MKKTIWLFYAIVAVFTAPTVLGMGMGMKMNNECPMMKQHKMQMNMMNNSKNYTMGEEAYSSTCPNRPYANVGQCSCVNKISSQCPMMRRHHQMRQQMNPKMMNKCLMWHKIKNLKHKIEELENRLEILEQEK